MAEENASDTATGIEQLSLKPDTPKPSDVTKSN